jgi:hypothetical protein
LEGRTIEDTVQLSMPDPGDEVQRRFRYQINYAALKALQLVSSDPTCKAVYCEHLEDVLIEDLDGFFTGIQIKTREVNQAPFRSNDAQIVGALKRFCVRDARFPGRFVRFVLATNFVFFEGHGAEDVRNILRCARENPTLQGIKPRDKIKKYVEEIADNVGVDVQGVVLTLAKVTIEDRRTGIDQLDLELVVALGEFPRIACLPMAEVHRMAKEIRYYIWSASSLAPDGLLLEAHTIVENLSLHVEQLRAKRKRLDASVISLLTKPTASDPSELLTIADYIERDMIPPGLGLMEAKMAIGGISYADVQQMKDDVSSLESAFCRWKERFGLPEANRRLAHFQYFASRDARIAEKTSASPDGSYGPAMLAAVRAATAQSIKAEHATMFGCRAEHLLGAVGLLSDQCLVWWSASRSLISTDGD